MIGLYMLASTFKIDEKPRILVFLLTNRHGLTYHYSLYISQPFFATPIEMERKYTTVLQMYGEKAEEAEERRLDLLDIKEMYKQQIDHLVSQLALTRHQNN